MIYLTHTIDFQTYARRALVGVCMFVAMSVLCMLYVLPAHAFVSPSVHNGFYSDVEESKENTFSASSLDITLSPESASVSMIQSASTTFATTLASAGSLAPRYHLSATHATTTCSDAFFGNIQVRALLGGTEVYSGALSGLASIADTATVGEWDFEVSVDSSYTPPALPDTCLFGIDFDAWREGVSEAQSGFRDVEHFVATLTLVAAPPAPLVAPVSTGVVLNEILPDPIGNDEAPKPNGEWVELYNNDSTTIDVAGWKIKDATNAAWTISTSNTNTGGTTIAPHGWLVVYRNGASMVLNNDGDTVSLYNTASTLIDSHTYGVTPENKSHARIPDGIGVWVDPIPTPGEANIPDPEPTTGNEEQATSGEGQTTQNTTPVPVPVPVPDQTTEEPVLEEAVVKEEEQSPEEVTEPEESILAPEETPQVGVAGTSPESPEEVSIPPQEPEPAREEETTPTE